MTTLELRSAHWANRQKFAKGIDIGGLYTNPFSSAQYVAGDEVTNPEAPTQGQYIQHRVTGDLNSSVQDAGASELRVRGVSNTSYLNGHECTVVFTSGNSVASDVRSIVGNMHVETATGSVGDASMVRGQAIPALPQGFTVDRAVSVWADEQVVGGTENWCFYAPAGDSFFDGVVLASPDGTLYRLTVANDGTLSTEAVA